MKGIDNHIYMGITCIKHVIHLFMYKRDKGVFLCVKTFSANNFQKFELAKQQKRMRHNKRKINKRTPFYKIVDS